MINAETGLNIRSADFDHEGDINTLYQEGIKKIAIEQSGKRSLIKKYEKEQKEVFDRSHVLAVMTVVQCWVKLGRITEEKGNEFLQKHTQEDIPHAKAAYEWAQNPDNDNARAAVEVLLPYLGADCEGAMSNEDLIKLLQPYLW